MKLSFTLLLAFSVFCIGCKEESTTPPITTTNILKATIDGKPWSSTTPNGHRFGYLSHISAGDMTDALFLEIPSRSVGTYPIDRNTDPSFFAMYANQTTDIEYHPIAGSVTVTEVDAAHIKGTFSFTCVTSAPAAPDTVTITDGSFDVLEGAAGGLKSKGTIAATIDGANWTTGYASVNQFGLAAHVSADDSANAIFIDLPRHTPGIYNVNRDSSGAATVYIMYANHKTKTEYHPIAGSATITEADAARVKGVFAFTCASTTPALPDTVAVTGGTFDIQY
jgi:hypothetical protein